MDQAQVIALLDPLMANSTDHHAILRDKQPFLAHYTSIENLEKIIVSEELWLSNPLFMNDLQELRYGMNRSREAVQSSKDVLINCLKSEERANIFIQSYEHYYKEYDDAQAFDTYVFCLSEHDDSNDDGLLSMWRGYGKNGHGAALVFNTSFALHDNKHPVAIAKVEYVDHQDRDAWIMHKLAHMCNILKDIYVEDDKIYLLSWRFFHISLVYALTLKYKGFEEEKEWRLIYLSDQDKDGMLKDCLHYIIGSRGVEPKLKMKIGDLDKATTPKWSFDSILHKIILGPSISNSLTIQGVRRMLKNNGKPDFMDRVRASGIPLRASF